MDIKKLLSTVRQAVEQYNMIEEGDKIAVGVSGGKDSVALLCAMAHLKRFYPVEFELCALCMDAAFYEAGYGTYEEAMAGFKNIEDLCCELGVEFYLIDTHIAKVVFDCKKEQNPCSLCAKMRRGALQNFASEIGCN